MAAPNWQATDHTVAKSWTRLKQLSMYQLTFPQAVHEGSLFSTSLLTFVICVLFDDSHSDSCEVMPHFRFDLHVSNN